MKEKRKNNKRVIILLIIVVFLIILVTFLFSKNVDEQNNENVAKVNNVEESYVEEIEAGVKINKSTKLNEAKEVNGLLVTNIQLTAESGITTLLADVTNNTGNRTEAKVVNITLLDYEGQELTTVTGIIKELNVGETTQLNISLTSDYVNAYDFRVEMN